MWKNILWLGKALMIGGGLLSALVVMLSLGFTGQLPQFSSPAARPVETTCASFQPAFEASLSLSMMEFSSALQRQQSVEQWVPGLADINMALRDMVYRTALESHPHLTCAVAFLQDQPLSLPAFVTPSMLERLYFAQRGMKLVPSPTREESSCTH